MAISISLKLPIINGFVSIPDSGYKLPPVTPEEVIAAIPTAYVDTLPFDMNKGVFTYRYLVLPAYDKANGAASDYYNTIRGIASAKLA